MNQMQINNQEDLTNLVKQGKDYYPILPEELERKLKLMSHIVSEQIEQNWNEKDLETSQIFNERKKQYKWVYKNDRNYNFFLFLREF